MKNNSHLKTICIIDKLPWKQELDGDFGIMKISYVVKTHGY